MTTNLEAAAVLAAPLAAKLSALAAPLKIGLGDGEDPRVQAAADGLAKNFKHAITIISKTPVKVGGVRNVTPESCQSINRYVDRLLQLRAHKGLTRDLAAKELDNPLYLSALMLEAGELDVVVSGSVSTTADVIRAGLHCVPRQTQTISSCFLMELQDGRSLIFSDCGVLPYPTAEQLCDIAEAAVHSRIALVGDTPKVAFLSFSTYGSAEHESVAKVRSAAQLFKERMPEVVSDGELQFDAAFVPAVAQRKCPGNSLGGMANILIFPNLDAGNIAYKLVERLAGARAVGPLIQGFKKPWLDLSRGCTALDIVSVAAAGGLLVGKT